MADRKTLLRTSGLVLVGFIVGAVFAGGLLAWRFSAWHREQYYDRLLSIANTAYMIRANRQQELLETIEGNLQQCVASADSLWGDVDQRLSAFWLIERYYEEFELAMPEDIKPILDRLPPRPKCSREGPQAENGETQVGEPMG